MLMTSLFPVAKNESNKKITICITTEVRYKVRGQEGWTSFSRENKICIWGWTGTQQEHQNETGNEKGVIQAGTDKTGPFQGPYGNPEQQEITKVASCILESNPNEIAQ